VTLTRRTLLIAAVCSSCNTSGSALEIRIFLVCAESAHAKIARVRTKRMWRIVSQLRPRDRLPLEQGCRMEAAELAHAIANELRAKGFKAYLVGGCVRDLLLGI